MPRPANRPKRRCLIVERHPWETGGKQQQLQFLLETARQFFGPRNVDRTIRVRLFMPPGAAQPIVERDIVISREYANGTRRTNRFPEMSVIPPGFVFFEETTQANTYDVWWQQLDTPVVAARYNQWSQGGNTQHGRGRLSVIVSAPVPRPIDRID